jgi:hypothetical protein
MGKDFEMSVVGSALTVTQNATPKTARPKRAIAGRHISVHFSPVSLGDDDGDGDGCTFVAGVVSLISDLSSND